MATFFNVKSFDTSGRCLMLYCFYVSKCADRDEGQPYCTDEWTAEQLGWNFKTVAEVRQKLITAKLIRMIRKGRKQYVQVQYLPFKVSNRKHRLLGMENIPTSVLSTTGVFDYYARWYDSIQGNPTRFINTVCKQVGYAVPKDKILQYLAGVYGKICRKGYGIDRIDNELSLFHYLKDSVTDKIRSNDKRKNKQLPPKNGGD